MCIIMLYIVHIFKFSRKKNTLFRVEIYCCLKPTYTFMWKHNLVVNALKTILGCGVHTCTWLQPNTPKMWGVTFQVWEGTGTRAVIYWAHYTVHDAMANYKYLVEVNKGKDSAINPLVVSFLTLLFQPSLTSHCYRNYIPWLTVLLYTCALSCDIT